MSNERIYNLIIFILTDETLKVYSAVQSEDEADGFNAAMHDYLLKIRYNPIQMDYLLSWVKNNLKYIPEEKREDAWEPIYHDIVIQGIKIIINDYYFKDPEFNSVIYAQEQKEKFAKVYK